MDLTVIIITYNQVEYVEEAVNSVLSQTQLPENIIISDDGSDDGTQKILREYKREYPDLIDLILSNKNEGISENLNGALHRVSTDAVALLAGDDRYRRRKLEIELKALQESDSVGIVFSNFAYTQEDGITKRHWTDSRPPEGNVLKECLLRDWPNKSLFRCPLISMNVFEQVGYYDTSLDIFEDWDFKIRASAVTEVKYCDTVLSEYRQHKDGISRRSGEKVYADTTKRVLENNRDLINKNFTDRERKKIENYLEGKYHMHNSFYLKEEKRHTASFFQYLRYLYTYPTGILNYQGHMRILLPTKLFDIIRRIYYKRK